MADGQWPMADSRWLAALIGNQADAFPGREVRAGTIKLAPPTLHLPACLPACCLSERRAICLQWAHDEWRRRAQCQVGGAAHANAPANWRELVARQAET